MEDEVYDRLLDEEARKGKIPNMPDFFAILRFDKMIGVRQAYMVDGTGEKCNCLIIPIIKNGIVREAKFHWRLIMSAYRMKTSRVPYVTHALAAFLDRAQIRFFKKRRYTPYLPIIGDIVKDLLLIKYAPAQSEEEDGHLTDAEKTLKQILQENKGKSFEEITGQKYDSYGDNYDKQMARSRVKESLRRKLFKIGRDEE